MHRNTYFYLKKKAAICLQHLLWVLHNCNWRPHRGWDGGERGELDAEVERPNGGKFSMENKMFEIQVLGKGVVDRSLYI